jgi:hypothetical protein
VAAKKKRKSRKLSPAQKHMRDHYKRYFQNYTSKDENYAIMARGAAALGIYPPSKKK